MSILARLVISVPIAAGSWIAGNNAMTASASQEIAPAKALELLARSRAVDAKCAFLTVGEHQELNDYVAKAEVSTAGREGPARARGAVKTGIHQGAAMECGRDSEIVVRATMDAARRAMAAVERGEVAASAPQKAKKKAAEPANDSRRKLARRPEVRSDANLKRYSAQAAAYYVERRCRHLSQKDVMQFWRRIAAKHNALLERYGPDAVRSAKNSAVSAAKRSGSCGGRTKKLVRAGYASIRRN